MVYKNILLITLLAHSVGILNGADSTAPADIDIEKLSTVSADTTSPEANGTEEIEAAKKAAAAIIEMARITAEGKIAAAERFGLEASKQWAPIAGSAICLFGLYALYSILK